MYETFVLHLPGAYPRLTHCIVVTKQLGLSLSNDMLQVIVHCAVPCSTWFCFGVSGRGC